MSSRSVDSRLEIATVSQSRGLMSLGLMSMGVILALGAPTQFNMSHADTLPAPPSPVAQEPLFVQQPLFIQPGSKSPSKSPVVSRVKLGKHEFSVEHERVEGWVDPPDLSRQGATPVPRAAIFRCPLPVLWEDRILPAGNFPVSILVGEYSDVKLALSPKGARARHILPVERADFSAPGDEILVSVQAHDYGDRVQGTLQIRWGALLLQGRFSPLLGHKLALGEWHLHTYHFPDETQVLESLPIGELQPTGSTRRWKATLLEPSEGRATVRLEERSYLRTLDERATLQRELSASRRRLSELTSASAPERASQARKVKGLEARLRGTEERLRRIPPEASTVDLTALRDPASSGVAPQVSVKLIPTDDDKTALQVQLPSGKFRFLLPDPKPTGTNR